MSSNDPLAFRGGKMTNQPRTFDYPVRKAKSCPVCGQSSYSKDGIHPQCAVQLADESRKEKLQAARKASQTGEPKQKSWNKQCPQCKTQLHVRRKECDCGHVFRQTKGSSSSND
jgi:rRNA maturation endonuclease Nob1